MVVCLLILLCVDVFFVPNFINPFSEETHAIPLLEIFRLPKALTAILTGSALAVSGFVLQQLFKNQLAGPYILGVSSGAGLMVTFFLVLQSFFSPFIVQLGLPFFGFLGAIGVLLLISLVSKKYGNSNIILLLGVVLSMILGAVQSLLVSLANPQQLQSLSKWNFGSFSQVLGADLFLFSILIGATCLFMFFKMGALSAMILGNDVAQTLGVHVKKNSFYLLMAAGLLTGVSTAYCGPIAFIGIAIPNVVKMIFKSVNFKLIFIANILLGASMALLGDIVSSLPIFNYHLPINITTSLLGGPIIIYILLKNMQK